MSTRDLPPLSPLPLLDTVLFDPTTSTPYPAADEKAVGAIRTRNGELHERPKVFYCSSTSSPPDAKAVSYAAWCNSSSCFPLSLYPCHSTVRTAVIALQAHSAVFLVSRLPSPCLQWSGSPLDDCTTLSISTRNDRKVDIPAALKVLYHPTPIDALQWIPFHTAFTSPPPAASSVLRRKAPHPPHASSSTPTRQHPPFRFLDGSTPRLQRFTPRPAQEPQKEEQTSDVAVRECSTATSFAASSANWYAHPLLREAAIYRWCQWESRDGTHHHAPVDTTSHWLTEPEGPAVRKPMPTFLGCFFDGVSRSFPCQEASRREAPPPNRKTDKAQPARGATWSPSMPSLLTAVPPSPTDNADEERRMGVVVLATEYLPAVPLHRLLSLSSPPSWCSRENRTERVAALLQRLSFSKSASPSESTVQSRHRLRVQKTWSEEHAPCYCATTRSTSATAATTTEMMSSFFASPMMLFPLVVLLFCGVAKALKALHRRGVLHGDVKLPNAVLMVPKAHGHEVGVPPNPRAPNGFTTVAGGKRFTSTRSREQRRRFSSSSTSSASTSRSETSRSNDAWDGFGDFTSRQSTTAASLVAVPTTSTPSLGVPDITPEETHRVCSTAPRDAVARDAGEVALVDFANSLIIPLEVAWLTQTAKITSEENLHRTTSSPAWLHVWRGRDAATANTGKVSLEAESALPKTNFQWVLEKVCKGATVHLQAPEVRRCGSANPSPPTTTQFATRSQASASDPEAGFVKLSAVGVMECDNPFLSDVWCLGMLLLEMLLGRVLSTQGDRPCLSAEAYGEGLVPEPALQSWIRKKDGKDFVNPINKNSENHANSTLPFPTPPHSSALNSTMRSSDSPFDWFHDDGDVSNIIDGPSLFSPHKQAVWTYWIAIVARYDPLVLLHDSSPRSPSTTTAGRTREEPEQLHSGREKRSGFLSSPPLLPSRQSGNRAGSPFVRFGVSDKSATSNPFAFALPCEVFFLVKKPLSERRAYWTLLYEFLSVILAPDYRQRLGYPQSRSHTRPTSPTATPAAGEGGPAPVPHCDWDRILHHPFLDRTRSYWRSPSGRPSPEKSEDEDEEAAWLQYLWEECVATSQKWKGLKDILLGL